MSIIDGKMIAAQVKEQLRQEADSLKERGITPGLAVVLVGDDPASAIYVRNKEKACEELGLYAEKYTFPEDTSQEQLLELIEELNENPAIHGILVQLPLPEQIDEQAVIRAIHPEKDVDCFHPFNVGRVMIGNSTVKPCTPEGIIHLLEACGIEIDGKECVVVGRSNIVGKPMAMLLLHHNATVTICHSHTENLAEVCRRADILICAVGKAGLITEEMVKPGAVVVDVGMNRREDGKLCGDVDFQQVKEKASYITPVPGGVGPMTIVMLMKNTIEAAKAQLTQQEKKWIFSGNSGLSG